MPPGSLPAEQQEGWRAHTIDERDGQPPCLLAADFRCRQVIEIVPGGQLCHDVGCYRHEDGSFLPLAEVFPLTLDRTLLALHAVEDTPQRLKPRGCEWNTRIGSMFEGFSIDTFRSRIAAAKEAATEAGLDGVLITPGPDFAYLLDSKMHTHERFAGLVLGAEDFVFAPGVDVADLKHSVAGELGLAIRGWNDGEDPYAFLPAGKLAVSAALTADHLLELQSRGIQAVNATKMLASAFVQKDEAEIRELTRAGEAIDAVHRKVPELLRAGVTEREVAEQLRELILAEHEVVDFIIVGSGPHGADPHHEFSDRVIQAGDIVVVDIGGTLDSGYHSDCTRTYVVGEPTPEQQQIYDVLQQAQEAGLAFAKPGVRAGEVDKVVRDIIEEAGYGEYFIHRTGHGIGLSCHEEPFIIAGNDVVLREGMAFSIEPGVYFSGRWGARIEDIVILEVDGARPMNLTSHQLQRV